MTLKKIPRLPRPQQERRVFSQRQKASRRLPLWRMMLDSVLLMLLGTGLIALLSWLPTKVDAMVVVSEAIADLIRGLGQLLEAVLGLSALILIAVLLVLGLFSLLSGLIRLVRALTVIWNLPARHPPPQSSRQAKRSSRSAARRRRLRRML